MYTASEFRVAVYLHVSLQAKRTSCKSAGDNTADHVTVLIIQALVSCAALNAGLEPASPHPMAVLQKLKMWHSTPQRGAPSDSVSR